MGQPHCRTCPFIDTRTPNSAEYATASQEGLCRVKPEIWRKVRLDYDWCGRHPEINLESHHDRMIRAINEAPPPSGDSPEVVHRPIHNVLSRIHAEWGGSSTQAIAGTPMTLNAGKVVWIVNVYPLTRSEQAAEELRADLGLLVEWARDNLFQEAKDPAAPVE